MIGGIRKARRISAGLPLALVTGVLTLFLVLPVQASGARRQLTVSKAPSVAAATNVGFCGGDDWEPEIAADGADHVYVVLAHFPGDPICDPASAGRREIFV